MPESNHADLLNSLNDMQRSLTYAGRRPVLTAAEKLIAEQERELTKLQQRLTAAADFCRANMHPGVNIGRQAMAGEVLKILEGRDDGGSAATD